MTDTGSVSLCDFNRDGCVDMLVTDINGHGPLSRATRRENSPTSRRKSGSIRPGAARSSLFADFGRRRLGRPAHGQQVFRNEEGALHLVADSDNSALPPPPPAFHGGRLRPGRQDRPLRYGLGRTRKADSWIEGEEAAGLRQSTLHEPGQLAVRGRHRSPAPPEAATAPAFTAAWLDADDDGWPDLYVPNEFGNGVLLVNQQDGTFTRAVAGRRALRLRHDGGDRGRRRQRRPHRHLRRQHVLEGRQPGHRQPPPGDLSAETSWP